MKKYLLTMVSLWTVLVMVPHTSNASSTDVEHSQDETPPYLYKILSLDEWMNSQSKSNIALPPSDSEFIHLATQAQLAKIANKHWSKARSFVILKFETSRLPGRLVYETNPGGTNKYYHLYDGSLPFKAIVDTEIVNASPR